MVSLAYTSGLQYLTSTCITSTDSAGADSSSDTTGSESADGQINSTSEAEKSHLSAASPCTSSTMLQRGEELISRFSSTPSSYTDFMSGLSSKNEHHMQRLQQAAIIVSFAVFSLHMLLSALPDRSKSLHEELSHSESYLVATVRNLVGELVVGNKQPHVQEKRGMADAISGIEWDPQDKFNMEIKDSFLVISVFSFILVNLLV